MKAVLLDFDGTLVDSIAPIIRSYHRAFDECDVPYPGAAAIKSHIGVGADVILKKYASATEFDPLLAAYRRCYLAAQEAGEVRFFPHTLPSLQALTSAGLRLAIVTSKLNEFAAAFLQQEQVPPLFELIVGAEDVTHKKPHPEPLLTAAEKLGLEPAECVYIGDTVHDGAAAQAAGMPFVGVSNGAGTAKDLAAYGPVYNDLEAVSTYLLIVATANAT